MRLRLRTHGAAAAPQNMRVPVKGISHISWPLRGARGPNGSLLDKELDVEARGPPPMPPPNCPPPLMPRSTLPTPRPHPLTPVPPRDPPPAKLRQPHTPPSLLQEATMHADTNTNHVGISVDLACADVAMCVIHVCFASCTLFTRRPARERSARSRFRRLHLWRLHLRRLHLRRRRCLSSDKHAL